MVQYEGMFGKVFSKSLGIDMVRVDLGKQSIHIPVAQIDGNQPGKTLLVTGGMDGDEYAGIEAAYRLIDTFKDSNFLGKLIIIPIVNVLGFQSEVSFNPEDNKYPKYVTKGKSNGTPTDRLIYWLHTTYAQKADAWLDFHDGSLTEKICPIFWCFETGKKEINILSQQVLAHMKSDVHLYTVNNRYSRAEELSNYDCLYCLTESGSCGSRKVIDIERHVTWAHDLMGVIGMIDNKPVQKEKISVYRKTRIFNAKKHVIWTCNVSPGEKVNKGHILGMNRSYDNKKTEVIKSKEDGIVLWMKNGMTVQKDDVLVAIGYEKEYIA
ncbi:succinylglutamate desuccinylase/aspartoacylase family protein [Patescibacteria group bacterium]